MNKLINTIWDSKIGRSSVVFLILCNFIPMVELDLSLNLNSGKMPLVQEYSQAKVALSSFEDFLQEGRYSLANELKALLTRNSAVTVLESQAAVTTTIQYLSSSTDVPKVVNTVVYQNISNEQVEQIKKDLKLESDLDKETLINILVSLRADISALQNISPGIVMPPYYGTNTPVLPISADSTQTKTLSVSESGTLANIIVSGTTKFNGVTYSWPSADGSANQFLRTNGSGTLVWATAGTASNSLDFDEMVNSMTLDANLSIASTSNNYTIDFNDTQVSFAGGRILSNGNVGIGTTGPGRRFDVLHADSLPQFRLSQSGSVFSELFVDSVGDLRISATGGDFRILDENMWICAGGACPSGTPTGTGNLIIEGNVGIGLSNPAAKLEITGDIMITSGSGGKIFFSDGTSLNSAGSANIVDGRLTLESGVPVTTTDQGGNATLYYTPYKGNSIALYDGSSNWNVRTFSELSIAVPASANTMYDVFVYDNSGTPTLELTAWTNDTTRATALVRQDGVYVKSGATTRRYVGSFRTTSSGLTVDTLRQRLVWNYYNRVSRAMRRLENATWTYSTATYRQANASAANQLEVVVGIAEVPVTVDIRVMFRSNAAGEAGEIAVGEDSTTTVVTGSTAMFFKSAANHETIGSAMMTKYPAVGYHYYVWLEKYCSGCVNTGTWSSSNPNYGGMIGWIEG